MTSIHNDDIRFLRRLIAESSDGPWGVSTHAVPQIGCSGGGGCSTVTVRLQMGKGHADAHLIAAAKNSLPKLLDELEELRRYAFNSGFQAGKDQLKHDSFVKMLRDELYQHRARAEAAEAEIAELRKLR